MIQQYNYWKRKRHVIVFILTVTLLTAFIVFLVLGAVDTLKHDEAFASYDPDYETPYILPTGVCFILSFFMLIYFFTDLFYFFRMRRRLRQTIGNNVEIKPLNSDAAMSYSADNKLLSSGVIADVNKSEVEEETAEYAYKVEIDEAYKDTGALIVYMATKPFILSCLMILVVIAMLWLLVNMGDLLGGLSNLISLAVISFLIFLIGYILLFIISAATKKKRKKFTKEVGYRIYADHLEQYLIQDKKGSLVEIRHKIFFNTKMKHKETKKHLFFKELNNGQMLALMLTKRIMPEEAMTLIKGKIEKIAKK